MCTDSTFITYLPVLALGVGEVLVSNFKDSQNESHSFGFLILTVSKTYTQHCYADRYTVTHAAIVTVLV